MAYKLHYSPEALNDLNEIQEYIETELCNSSAALNMIDNILYTVEKLENYPAMGTKLSITADIESDYRFIISGSYMVFYRHCWSRAKLTIQSRAEKTNSSRFKIANTPAALLSLVDKFCCRFTGGYCDCLAFPAPVTVSFHHEHDDIIKYTVERTQ